MYSLSSSNPQSWLSWFLRGVLVVIFLILFSKLFEIQIIKGDYYRALSQENRIRRVPIPAPRGNILARGGEVLAGNIDVEKKIEFDKLVGFKLTETAENADSEDVVVDYQRIYPLAEKFAHASGYVGLPVEGQVGKIDPNCPEKGPRQSDVLIGKNGLELQYECLLSGIPGEDLIEVDTKGVKIRSLGRREPVPGTDLVTTIDYNLQLQVAISMSEIKGAAIVTDTKGGILAFFSGPSFDPNLLVTKSDNTKISELFNDQNLPFFNRVIGGTFHPGSVYKPLISIAALEEGVIDKGFSYEDTGVVTVNDFSYTTWYFTEYGRAEGVIDLVRAIARSTDTFFYKVGELVGPQNLAKWSVSFGLDKKTGVDLPGEVDGLIPSPEWKKRVKNENWFLGNTYHMSIGQGDVAVTPIALNSFISAIAAGGEICTPHFAKAVDAGYSCSTISLKEENVDLVKEGMKQACEAGGTAHTFFDFAQTYGGTEVACKTGTAETGGGRSPHAWFTVFAPIENPEIVVTILVEEGGQGSDIAGPIAREIMDVYYSGARTSN